jgi:hypothetical protein
LQKTQRRRSGVACSLSQEANKTRDATMNPWKNSAKPWLKTHTQRLVECIKREEEDNLSRATCIEIHHPRRKIGQTFSANRVVALMRHHFKLPCNLNHIIVIAHWQHL